MSHSLFFLHEKGIVFFIKVTPKAAQNRIGKIMLDDKHTEFLKLYVTAVPEGGKANEAVIELLRKKFKLKKTQIIILQGISDSRKKILIAGDPKELLPYLENYLKKL